MSMYCTAITMIYNTNNKNMCNINTTEVLSASNVLVIVTKILQDDAIFLHKEKHNKMYKICNR